MQDLSVTQIKLAPDEWLETPSAILEDLGAIQSGDITIDASECTSIGAHSVQILLAARRFAQTQGGTVQMDGASESLWKELSLLGLRADLSNADGAA